MFAPTKVWRRWNRKTNLEMRRQATASALAASAVPAIVMARGHKIEEVPEVPLVIENLERVERTKDLLALLRKFGVGQDLDRVALNKQKRAGRGKSRNRRYALRKGPLLVYEEDNCPLLKAHRNIPGLDACSVHKLNLLQLAPGGTLGRFLIWSSEALKSLNNVFGTLDQPSAEMKNWMLPRSIMTTPDLQKLLDSEAIQGAFKSPTLGLPIEKHKGDPYKDRTLMDKLDPHSTNTAPEEPRSRWAEVEEVNQKDTEEDLDI